ncbi:DEKNAAC102761 [Brettanomyces naardenensis]|uniref:adenosylmethionine decarboxylase n=1 Tax=Brettanomyces naardenensis TaxID=13370 RepID=A0A448YL36_BRENA|nr:DEKNAAC102761 [Brettanomyces naardenensis]
MTPSIIFKNEEESRHYQGSTNDLDFVNHELSVNLDSTSAFEGPEKLLEIWFAPSQKDLPLGWPSDGLRHIPLSGIEDMLQKVNCSILSKISSPALDAYLLSESSLFVFAHKLILKTCGTTTTLFSLEPLLELVRKYCHYSEPNLMNSYRVFYSRRSFMFPDKQHEVQKCWPNELAWLDRYFPSEKADSYVVGNLATDHWHFYMNGTNRDFQTENHIEPDQTLEILMTDLDPVAAGGFEMQRHSGEFPHLDPAADDYGHLLGQKMLRLQKLDKIVDVASGKSKHDAFAFTPCGFSSNTILEDKYYCTLHITPERGWSYASFETNYPHGSKVKMINKVIQSLRPSRFFISFIQEIGKSGDEDFSFGAVRDGTIRDYERHARIVYDLRFNYRLLYCYYEKIADDQ